MTSFGSSGKPLVMDDDTAIGNMDGSGPHLGAAFDQAAVAMALLDLDGRYVRVNRSLCALTGYDDDELVGRSVWSLTHPDDLARGHAGLEHLLAAPDEPFALEKRYRRRDGAVVWVLFSGTRVDDEHGQPAGFLVCAQDISERRRAEEALAAQHASMRLLHDVTAACNAAQSLAEAAAGCLPAICAQTGWTAGALWLVRDGEILDGGAAHDGGARSRPAAPALVARVAQDAQARWTWELPDDGARAAFAFPVVAGGAVPAVLELLADDPLPPDGALLDVLEQVGAQLGQVVRREQATAALRRSEDRCRRIIDTAGDAFVEVDDAGRIGDWNQRAEELFGWSRDEVAGRDVGEVLVAERDRAAYRAELARFAQTGESRLFGRRLDRSAVHRDGHELPVEVTLWPIRYGDGWHVGAFLRDVSAQRRAQEALREAQERFAKAFEHAPIGMALVGLDGRFAEVNRALCRMLGRTDEELVGRRATELIDPQDVGVGADLAARAATGALSAYTVEQRWRRSDGTALWGLASIASVTDAGERPRAYVMQVEDVTERRKAEAALAHRALHDPLTGLANRQLFLDHLGQALNRSERLPSSLAVLFCDLDGFKDVNDRLGHDAGDAVLVAVAQRLRAAVRPADTVARLGGDEFVVLCEDLSDQHEALAIAERLEAAVAAPVEVADAQVSVTVSVGVAVADDAARDPQQLLRAADGAMYAAKSAGKARTHVSQGASGRPGAGSVGALRAALTEQRMVLRYLPIVALADRRVVGVEALLRYRTPEGHLVTPEEFLGAAEDSGLIVEMGAWALGEAYRQASRWREVAPALQVSVNLSARQLARPDLGDVLAGAAAAAGVAADAVALEVSEGVLLRASSASAHGLDALRAAGVRVGLDDVGTAASSVGELSRANVDYVKIDRSLVAGLGVSAEDTAAVAAVLSLARALGMSSVAEGVEREAQVGHLRRLGCDLAQGFHFAPPQPPEAITPLLT